ncbi:hypothetical protein Tco_1326176 [Tanacetum coccineum]
MDKKTDSVNANGYTRDNGGKLKKRFEKLNEILIPVTYKEKVMKSRWCLLVITSKHHTFRLIRMIKVTLPSERKHFWADLAILKSHLWLPWILNGQILMVVVFTLEDYFSAPSCSKFNDIVAEQWLMSVDGYSMYRVVTKMISPLKKPLRNAVNNPMIEWLDVGDSNSSYFHKSVKCKNQRSRIDSIRDNEDNEVTGTLVTDCFVKHYHQFLGVSAECDDLNNVDLFPKCITSETSMNMVRNITNKEIKTALFIHGRHDRALELSCTTIIETVDLLGVKWVRMDKLKGPHDWDIPVRGRYELGNGKLLQIRGSSFKPVLWKILGMVCDIEFFPLVVKARLLLKEAEAAEAIRLCAEASNFETMEKSLQDETNALKEHNVILKKERNALDVKVHELELSSSGLQEKVTVYENCMEQLEKF